jgi:hypothetical protein
MFVLCTTEMHPPCQKLIMVGHLMRTKKLGEWTFSPFLALNLRWYEDTLLWCTVIGCFYLRCAITKYLACESCVGTVHVNVICMLASIVHSVCSFYWVDMDQIFMCNSTDVPKHVHSLIGMDKIRSWQAWITCKLWAIGYVWNMCSACERTDFTHV